MDALRRLLGRLAGSRGLQAWAWAAGLVALTFAVRLALQPMLGDALAHSAFYPATVLAAYALGRRYAVGVMLAAAILGFWCFALPHFAWKTEPKAFISLILFTLNAGVLVYVITSLTRALDDVAVKLGRAQAAAVSHAGLFRELNERISLHMRLVAGVLQLQAKGEPEPQVADSLKKTMERSLLIARVHRELGGHAEDQPVEFTAFAGALARAICQSKGQPPERVTVEGPELVLPGDEAVSLGAALAEGLAALLDTKPSHGLRLGVSADAGTLRIAIAEAGGGSSAALVSVSNGYLLRAMAEQLGAAVALRADSEGSALVLSLPRAAAEPRLATLH
ncbi:DUF4118 domain-containing protein [Phenylobacterium sp. VNQ135]|uniref:DUF4118 domain-containing protein n=1 Tax=Phenylobacterium sp. VNQ135 TaxID=3400922 RepID=UPI003C0805B8